ncbi:MAG: hypothetical protein H7Z74_03110 [Anaerolineae bacterium]|nr:hypothetical protein [Gemmatimonadaceae bacterium]
MNLARKLNALVDGWFTAPEPNAAGRIGLFRILYSAFYIWHTSFQFAASMAGFPDLHSKRIFLLGLFPVEVTPELLALLESSLVAALVLLMIGFKVRPVTALVLIGGCVLEAFHTRADAERGSLFLVFYIPLFMLLCNARWGATYSLDALLERRAGKPLVEPSSSFGAFFIPARAVLAMLGLLFLSAALLKIAAGGTWLDQPRFMADLMLEDNVDATIKGLPLNPLAALVSGNPALYRGLLYQVIVFEGLFFLGLFSRALRSFFLALAVVFHAVGAIWLTVTFTQILIVYALYIDWQKLRERVWPKRADVLAGAPSGVLIAATICLAVVAGAFWNQGNGLRSVINLGGRLDWHTVWYPILPLSLIWLVLAVRGLVRSLILQKTTA